MGIATKFFGGKERNKRKGSKSKGCPQFGRRCKPLVGEWVAKPPRK